MLEQGLIPAQLEQASFYADTKGLKQLVSGSDSQQAISRVAKEFESLYIHMMFKSMRQANAVFSNDNPFESQQSEFFRDMLDNQYSVELARSGGIGLADVLIKQLGGSEDGIDSKATHIPVNESIQEGVPPLSQRDVIPSQAHALMPLREDQAPDAFEYLYGDSQSSSFLDSESLLNKDRLNSDNVATDPFVFETQEAFIQTLMPHARHVAEKLGVDPKVLVAQAALETGWGKHIMSDGVGGSSYNLFGIKAGQSALPSVTHRTMEYSQNTPERVNQSFRVYESFAHSFQDYASLLTQNDRYQKALEFSHSPEAFTEQLQAAGYATDPQYAKKIQAIYGQLAQMMPVDKGASTEQASTPSASEALSRLSVLNRSIQF